eukprot:RCo034284
MPAPAAVDFEELKRGLLFHEHRLKGLYESAFGEEIRVWLEEKNANRTCAREECDGALRHVEEVTRMPFRGKWTGSRIPAYLRLEVESRFLVGSSDYEVPETASEEAMFELLGRVEELNRAQNQQDPQKVSAVKKALQGVRWSRQDVNTISGALSAKSGLLEELANLFGRGQEKAWAVSRMEAKREELLRKGDAASRDGELAVANEILYDRLVLGEDLMRVLDEKLEMTPHPRHACLDQKQAKSKSWKLGAATLEVLKEAKMSRIQVCEQDLEKLRRGMEFEAKQRQTSRAATQQDLTENHAAFTRLSAELDQASQQLVDLAEQFVQAEARLRALSTGRKVLVTERLDLIAQEAQLSADFEEFLTSCHTHEENLQATIANIRSSADALEALQEYSAGSTSFLGQNFSEVTGQLHAIRESCLLEIHAVQSEYYRDYHAILRGLDAQQKKIETSMVDLEIQAERMREVLNPMAKKFVDEVRKLQADRAAIEQEREALGRRVAATEQKYFAKVRDEMAELKLPSDPPVEDVEWRGLTRREELADYRDTLQEHPVDRVLVDRDDLVLAQR